MKTINNWKYPARIVAWSTTLLLSGCVSWVYTPGKSELRELCEKDGGFQIYEEVKVDGFFAGSIENCYACWDEIIVDGFSYIEFENKNPKSYDAIREKGYWRLEKVRRSSGLCNAEIDKKLSSKHRKTNYYPFLDNYCIGSTKLDHISSGYGIWGSVSEEKINEYYGSTITRTTSEIRSINEHVVIGKSVNYLLNPWPNSSLSYGKVIDCKDIGVVQRQKSLFFQVFIPRK